MALRYWVGGTANWDGTAGTKWATTSGGAGGASVPTSSDDVIFDSASGSGIVTISTTVNAKSVNFTGFTGSFSGGTVSMNIAGNVTFDITYTTTSTAILYIYATSTLTSNGASWGGTLQFSAPIGSTLTIVGDANFKGYTNLNNNPANSVNGANVYISGGTYFNSSHYGSIGTAKFIITGNVTITALSLNDTTLDAGINTINFNNGATYIVVNSCKITYVSGVITNNPSTFLNIYNNVIFDTSLMTWGTLLVFNSSTVTLLSDLNCNSIKVNSGTSIINGLFNVNINGNLVCNATIQGTSNFVYTGTGTWSGAGTLKNNLTINTAGTITISGTVAFNTGTLTYTVGTVVTTSSTLNIYASTTLNTNGITWNNITISNGTVTLNSLLTVSSNLTVGSSGAVTFSGTAGFNCGSFICVTAGRTITLKNGITYTVNNSLTLTGTVGSRITLQSSTTSSAFFNLNPAATQSVTNTNATWINSAGGKTIWTSAGTLSNTVNWSIGTEPLNTGNFFMLL